MLCGSGNGKPTNMQDVIVLGIVKKGFDMYWISPPFPFLLPSFFFSTFCFRHPGSMVQGMVLDTAVTVLQLPVHTLGVAFCHSTVSRSLKASS